MKKLFIILLLAFAFSKADAQTRVKSWYIYDKGGYDSVMLVPMDTALIKERNKVHLGTKNEKLYVWSPSLMKWIALSGSGGGSVSHHAYAFPAASNGQFTVPDVPVASTVKVTINGIGINPTCFSTTVNTITINTGCLGFTLSPSTDTVIIDFDSL